MLYMYLLRSPRRHISGGLRAIVTLQFPLAFFGGGRKRQLMMESTEIRGLHVDTSTTVEGGVEDAYGEDRATEDQLVTPWIVSIARSIDPSTLTSLKT